MSIDCIIDLQNIIRLFQFLRRTLTFSRDIWKCRLNRGVLKETVVCGVSGFISIKIQLHAYKMVRVPSRPINESSSN